MENEIGPSSRSRRPTDEYDLILLQLEHAAGAICVLQPTVEVLSHIVDDLSF